ncbi:MAG: SIR2 family protein [Rhizobium sp.]|nr:SIR2 family protein [Rhizobium sp.]
MARCLKAPARWTRFSLPQWTSGEKFQGDLPPILHWHGVFNDPSSIVFTGDDYYNFYTAERTRFLETMWTSRTVLTVGFGYRDPYFTRVLEHVLRNYNSDNRHFALIGNRDEDTISLLARKTFSRKYRVNPVFYTVKSAEDGREDHSDLIRLLEALSETTLHTPEVSSAGAVMITSEPVERARVDFQQNLFVSPSGTQIYSEPRLLRLNSPEFRRHPPVTFSAAFRTRRATASRF